MPRFVVLAHDWPYPHFDFLLEEGSYLLGWRLEKFPQRGEAISAMALPDHRPFYLDHEGPLTGERGSVRQIDRGTFEWIERTSVNNRVKLDGEILFGPAEWLPDRSIWRF